MIFFKLLEPLGADFVVYYEAARMVFVLHGNPYFGLITRTFPYNYPPPSLLMLWPLTFFNFNTASVLWNTFSLLAVFISIFLVAKIAWPIMFRKINGRAALLLSGLFFIFTIPFFPVKFDIGNGQINHFILLFFVLAIYFYTTGKKNWSAFFLAFATGIKLAPAVFVLYWLIKGDWRQIGRFLIFLLIIFALPAVFLPLKSQVVYVTHVMPLSFTLGAKDWYYNQSLEGFLARSFRTSSVILGLTDFFSIVIVILTWWRGRRISVLRAMSAVSILYLLVHPIALQHYFGFTIIPFVFLGAELWRKNANWKIWGVLALAYLLIAFDIKNFGAVPRNMNFVLSHDFYGIVMLWILALWQEKVWRILAVLWIVVIAFAYLALVVCRGGRCL